MNVQQLIDKLNEIEDKTKEVIIYDFFKNYECETVEEHGRVVELY